MIEGVTEIRYDGVEINNGMGLICGLMGRVRRMGRCGGDVRPPFKKKIYFNPAKIYLNPDKNQGELGNRREMSPPQLSLWSLVER